MAPMRPRAFASCASLVVLAAAAPGTSPGGDESTEAAARPPALPPPSAPLAAERGESIDLAVRRGLDWLVGQQQACGGWLGDAGHKQGDDYEVFLPAELTATLGGAHAGVSAIAGLAFLADGQVPDQGPYAGTLDRVVAYLLSRQNQFGYFEDGGSRMYSHSFATLFLAQVHGMFPRRTNEIEAALRKAVDFTQQAQNEHGAWRYLPFTIEADLSVTVCQVQALRAAKDAGIPVSASVIDRVIDYVRDSRIEYGSWQGAYYYKIHGRSARTKTSFTVNAAAVTTMHSAGLYEEREYATALDYVRESYEDLSDRYPDHFYFWYGNYYAAQALLIEGGERWRSYWPRLRDDLLERQRADGSWRNSEGPGDCFSTAVACILLRVPAQYLPIFQR